MSFYPCELHCHTIHSDGDFTIEQLQLSAKENGLSLIALTDHNTFSGHNELSDEIIPSVKAIEWTTYFGHMLVLGAKSFVDWRDATPDNIDSKIQAVKENGGLVGIAHPFQLGSPMCTGGRWEFNVNKWENVNYIEIWHQAFTTDNYENEKATEFWYSLLDKGYKLSASYGRDWHRKEKTNQYGCTYLDIDGEINEANALEAIKKGRMVASTGASFYFEVFQNEKEYKIGDTISDGEAVFSFSLDLNARTKYHTDNNIECEKIIIKTNEGRVVAQTGIDKKLLKLNLERGHWYNAELWGKINGKDMPLAITSPIYT